MRRSSDATLETPVTQMIDIVFLLIIFFVVTASVDNDLVDNTISLAQAKNTKAESIAKKMSVTINMKMEKDASGKLVVVNGRPKISYNIALQPKPCRESGRRSSLSRKKQVTSCQSSSESIEM